MTLAPAQQLATTSPQVPAFKAIHSAQLSHLLSSSHLYYRTSSRSPASPVFPHVFCISHEPHAALSPLPTLVSPRGTCQCALHSCALPRYPPPQLPQLQLIRLVGRPSNMRHATQHGRYERRRVVHSCSFAASFPARHFSLAKWYSPLFCIAHNFNVAWITSLAFDWDVLYLFQQSSLLPSPLTLTHCPLYLAIFISSHSFLRPQNSASLLVSRVN